MRELSHNRRVARNDEREMDVFELEELRQRKGNIESSADYTYGLYEDLTYGNCYGVEEVYNTYEEEWN